MYELEVIKSTIKEFPRKFAKNIIMFLIFLAVSLLFLSFDSAKADAKEKLIEEPLEELAGTSKDLSSTTSGIISEIVFNSFEPTLNPFYSYTTNDNPSFVDGLFKASTESEVKDMNLPWNNLNSITKGPIHDIRKIANYTGAYLAVGILVFTILSFFFNGSLTDVKDNPLLVIFKFLIVIGACYFADEIMNLFIQIVFQVWQNAVGAIDKDSYASMNSFTLDSLTSTLVAAIAAICTAFISVLITAIVAIILTWILFKNLLRLWFECAERYVVLCLLVLFFPAVMPTYINRNSSNILKAYFRMLIGQAFLLLSGVAFLKIIYTMMISQVTSASIMGYVLTLALLRTAQRLDSHLASMGLNIAQTGGGFFDSIGATINHAVSSINTGRKNLGGILQSRGLETGNKELYKTGSKLGVSVGSMVKAGGLSNVGNEHNFLKDMGVIGKTVPNVNASVVRDAVMDSIKNPASENRSVISAIDKHDINKAAQDFLNAGAAQKVSVLENALASGSQEKIKSAQLEAMSYSGLEGATVTGTKHNFFNGSLGVTGTYADGKALAGIISAQKESKNSVSLGNGLYFTPENALPKSTMLKADGKSASSAFMQMGIPGAVGELQKHGIDINNIGALRNLGNGKVQVLDKNSYVMATVSSSGDVTRYAQYAKNSNRNTANTGVENQQKKAGYPLNYNTSLKNIGQNSVATLEKQGITNAGEKLKAAGVDASNIGATSIDTVTGKTKVYDRNKNLMGEFSKDGAFTKAEGYENPQRVKMQGHEDMLNTYLGSDTVKQLADRGISTSDIADISHINGNVQLRGANNEVLAEISSDGKIYTPDGAAKDISSLANEIAGQDVTKKLSESGVDTDSVKDFSIDQNGDMTFYGEDGSAIAKLSSEGTVELPGNNTENSSEAPAQGILNDLAKEGIDVSQIGSIQKDEDGNFTLMDNSGNTIGSFNANEGFSMNEDYKPQENIQTGTPQEISALANDIAGHDVMQKLSDNGIDTNSVKDFSVAPNGDMEFYKEDGSAIAKIASDGTVAKPDVNSEQLTDASKQGIISEMAKNGISVSQISSTQKGEDGNFTFTDSHGNTIGSFNANEGFNRKEDYQPRENFSNNDSKNIVSLANDIAGHDVMQKLSDNGIDTNAIRDFSVAQNGDIAFLGENNTLVAKMSVNGEINASEGHSEFSADMPQQGIMSDMAKNGIDISKISNIQRDSNGNIELSDTNGNIIGNFNANEGFSKNENYQPSENHAAVSSFANEIAGHDVMQKLSDNGIDTGNIKDLSLASNGEMAFFNSDNSVIAKMSSDGTVTKPDANSEQLTGTSQQGIMSEIAQSGIDISKISNIQRDNNGNIELSDSNGNIMGSFSTSEGFSRNADYTPAENHASSTPKDFSSFANELAGHDVMQKLSDNGVDTSNIKDLSIAPNGDMAFYNADNSVIAKMSSDGNIERSASAEYLSGVPKQGIISEMASNGVDVSQIGNIQRDSHGNLEINDINGSIIGSIDKNSGFNANSNYSSSHGKADVSTIANEFAGHNVMQRLSDSGISASDVKDCALTQNGEMAFYGADNSVIAKMASNKNLVLPTGETDFAAYVPEQGIIGEMTYNGVNTDKIASIQKDSSGGYTFTDTHGEVIGSFNQHDGFNLNTDYKPHDNNSGYTSHDIAPLANSLAGHDIIERLKSMGVDTNNIKDFAVTQNDGIAFYGADNSVVAKMDSNRRLTIPTESADFSSQMPEQGIISEMLYGGADISRIDSIKSDDSGNYTVRDIYGNTIGNYNRNEGFNANSDYKHYSYSDKGIMHNLLEAGVNPSAIASTGINEDGNTLFYANDGRLMGMQTSYGDFNRDSEYTDVSYIPNNNLATFTSRIGSEDAIQALNEGGINWNNVAAAYVDDNGTTQLVNDNRQLIAEIAPDNTVHFVNPGNDIYYSNYTTETLKDLGYSHAIKEIQASGIDIDDIYLRYNDNYQSIQIVDSETDFVHGYINEETKSFEHFNAYYGNVSSSADSRREPQTYNDIFAFDDISNMCHIETGGEFSVSSNASITESDQYGVFTCPVTKTVIKDGKETKEEYQLYLHNTVVHNNIKGLPEYTGKDGNTYYVSMVKKSDSSSGKSKKTKKTKKKPQTNP